EDTASGALPVYPRGQVARSLQPAAPRLPDRAVPAQVVTRAGGDVVTSRRRIEKARQQREARKPDEHIDDGRDAVLLAEGVTGDRGDQVELEESDEQPVECTDDYEQKRDRPE